MVWAKEKLLMVWVKQLQENILAQSIIYEKAWVIYDYLLKQAQHPSTEDSEESGLFWQLLKRTGCHSVISYGKAVSSDVKAAEDYF